MSSPAQFSGKVSFGEFELSLETAELRRNGSKSILPGQPFQILVTLLSRPGQLVTREELKRQLWPSDTFVDFDVSLNKAVNRLREALNDTAENPRFIETLPRRGYRFIGSLKDEDQVDQVVRERGRFALPMTIIAMMMGIALGCLFWFAKRSSEPTPEMKIWQLTTNSDENPVRNGAISPDGKYLAFADPKRMYIKSIGTGEIRVIPQPEELINEKITWVVISWFPDGLRFVANAHPAGTGGDEWNSQSTSIWVVSVMGGSPRKLRDSGRCYSISPDGSLIAFGMNKGRFGEREIWFMDSDGQHPRKLIESADESAIEGFSWSPDGERASYIRHNENLYKFKIIRHSWKEGLPAKKDEGSATDTTLPLDTLNVFDRTELPGGHLILSVEEHGTVNKTCNFWTLPLDQLTGRPIQKPHQLTNWSGYCMTHLSVTKDGKQLAFLRWRYGTSTYVADLEANGSQIGSPRHFTLTESLDYPLGWTADSKAILFASSRSGHWAVYKQLLNQDTAELLVGGLDNIRSPRISADGKWFLYGLPARPADQSSESNLMRVPIAGGPPRLVLTAPARSQILCAWAPSTQCLLGEPTQDRTQIILRAFDPLKGRGDEVTRFDLDPSDDRWSLALSTDGTRIAATRNPEGPIHILSLRGKAAQKISVKDRKGILSLAWATDGKGLYVSSEAQGGAELLYVNFQGKSQALWKNRAGNYTAGFPSPDGHHLAIMGLAFDGNIWMTENF
jgi:Tol biopolymer transport system component/DNA-binding winged helix-turn-helix (wHTH) protein